MKTLDLVQGSPKWLSARAQYDTASECSAMMGVSKHQTRSALLQQKATGLTQEVDAHMQALFDRGHATEAAARAIVEKMIGEDLYPVTGVHDDMNLLASMDGMTMDGTTLFEHKLWNPRLSEDVLAGDLEPHYYWQLEQQLLVSGAEKVIFVVSDGTEENFSRMTYYPVPGRAKQLIAGWAQFADDLENYQHVEVIAAPVAASIANLPALLIQMTGEVVSSNLFEYQTFALGFIKDINTTLTTDQHFADAEAMVKFCNKAETELDIVKALTLKQTATIDDLFRTIDSLQAALKAKRLELDKLVKNRKESIRAEIVSDGRNALANHIDALIERIGGRYLPGIAVDFASAIKGKRTLDSMRDAVDTELARAKIAANEVADRITINLRTLGEYKDLAFLFADTAALVLKAPDDLQAVIQNRAVTHQAAEAARLAAETTRIAEQERIKAEAKARQELADQTRETDVSKAQMAAQSVSEIAQAMTEKNEVDPAPTLKLGQINERLAPISLTADGLASLGFSFAATEKNAKLYRESDFELICAALVNHINNIKGERN